MSSQGEDYIEDNVTWGEQIMDINGKVDALVTNQNVMVENHNAMMAAISKISEKLGKVVSSETFTAGQTAGNVNVTRRLATTTRSTPPRLSNPLQNSQPFESANFRHQSEQSQEAKEDPSTAPTILTGSPYFRTRLSSANNFDLPRTDSALVRSIPNIDPTKSGILLTYFWVPPWSRNKLHHESAETTPSGNRSIGIEEIPSLRFGEAERDSDRNTFP
jgi:hypothetical protein